MAFAPTLHQKGRYNSEEHYAPPIRIQWLTHSKELFREHLVFVLCCGQTEQVKKDVDEVRLVTSIGPCKYSPSKANETKMGTFGQFSYISVTISPLTSSVFGG